MTTLEKKAAIAILDVNEAAGAPPAPPHAPPRGRGEIDNSRRRPRPPCLGSLTRPRRPGGRCRRGRGGGAARAKQRETEHSERVGGCEISMRRERGVYFFGPPGAFGFRDTLCRYLRPDILAFCIRSNFMM